MADIAQLERALINADKAGDADAAKLFAGEIRKMRAAADTGGDYTAQAQRYIDDNRSARSKQAKADGAAGGDALMMAVPNLVAGGLRGAGSIGSTILAPRDMLKDAFAGKGLSLESNRERRASIDGGLREMGANPDSLMYKTGKLGGEIAGTAGAGGVLANGARAVGASPALVNSLATSGMRAGATPGAMNMLTRVAGGAITGGTAAGMINPEDARTGAVIGGLLPPIVAGSGMLGTAIGQRIAGPAVPDNVRQSVDAARSAGYVIPPAQAKPTMFNRALEGFAGKASTAQNASTKNQAITNELAKKAIGAKELTAEGLAEVRSAANAAYDKLGQVGAFQEDDAFRTALQKAGNTSAQMRKDFPELVNSEVDDLIAGLSSRGEFDSQSAIEAIKQFRFNGSANRAAQDPAKKALGKAQLQIAGTIEDLIDRNLQAAGAQDLLGNYRSARQTLAKVYDIEKALNPSSGNIDAAQIAKSLKKGRPLTGELQQIGDFASQFPKAAQSVDKMGSLPQVSPLDYLSTIGIGTATGNPLALLALGARPAARSLALASPVQNRLSAQSPNKLAEMLINPASEQMLYRSAPALGTSR